MKFTHIIDAIDTIDENSEYKYTNIEITDNVIYNGHIHGIYLGETKDLNISNNTLAEDSDAFSIEGKSSTAYAPPRIRVANESEDIKIHNNISEIIIAPSHADLDGNIDIDHGDEESIYYVGDVFGGKFFDTGTALDKMSITESSNVNLMNVGSLLLRETEIEKIGRSPDALVPMSFEEYRYGYDGLAAEELLDNTQSGDHLANWIEAVGSVDRVDAGDGNDFIRSGYGHDSWFFGESGIDIFFIEQGFGTIRLGDWEVGLDRVMLGAGLDLADFLKSNEVYESLRSTVFTNSEGDRLIFHGIESEKIANEDFINSSDFFLPLEYRSEPRNAIEPLPDYFDATGYLADYALL